MQRPWGKLWFRIVAAILCAPIIMTPTAIVIVDLYNVVTEKAFNPGELLPPFNVLLVMIAVEWVMVLPVLIAVEIGNRRRGLPMPPGLYALHLLILAAAYMASLSATVLASERNGLASEPAVAVSMVFGCYILAVALTIALASPFVRRWQQKALSVRAAELTF